MAMRSYRFAKENFGEGEYGQRQKVAGGDVYQYQKAEDVGFTNGKYYQITVKMTRRAN